MPKSGVKKDLEQVFTKKSFAKINLYLEIVGRTNNGYHLLDSLMVMIDIFDLISIEKHHKLELLVIGSESLQEDWQENIIIKAVNLLAKKYHFAPNIKITLEKNIPIAAGLGGGSSNAATVLLMLNQFYDLNLSKAELLDLGLKLGADVPFFINGKNAFVSGIGEVLQDADFNFKNIHLIIINPRQALSTKQVYGLCVDNFVTETVLKSFDMANPLEYDKNLLPNMIDFIGHRRNDLQKPAIKIMPKISDILQAIANQKNCLITRMSGSGASCFGIFARDDLDFACSNLQRMFPSFYVKKVMINNLLTKLQ